ncbi:MAG: hypothetical protein L0Y58_14330 [Verrucomicrobia subdivision 3 bacterium]|nr:hypothetical protein [Limisphaerales bacterium]
MKVVAGFMTAIAVGLAACASVAAETQFALQRLAVFGFSDDGTQPTSLIQGLDGSLYGTTSGSVNAVLRTNGTVFKLTPGGQLTILASFDPESDGFSPRALLQAPDGSFYGAAGRPGVNRGHIFHLTAGGEVSIVFSFNGTNGSQPRVLIYGSDDNLYGTTEHGGSAWGTIFRLTRGGALTTLFSFSRTNGINPTSLVRAKDGTLFGTTSDWISVGAPDTVFRLSPSGEFKILVSWETSEISRPWSVIAGSDGCLYGVDAASGTNDFGSVFKVTPAGALTVFARFNGTNGWGPDRLIQGADGSFYGTTAAGGRDFAGWIPTDDGGYVSSGSGTFFRVTVDGKITALASFADLPGDDVTGLLQTSDGVFYGAQTSGGPPEPAGVFRVAPLPEITGLQRLSGRDVVTWNSFSGGVFQIEGTPTLMSPTWTRLAQMTSASRQTAFTNVIDVVGEHYYRIRLLP